MDSAVTATGSLSANGRSLVLQRLQGCELLRLQRLSRHIFHNHKPEVVESSSVEKGVTLPFPIQRKEGGFANTKPGYDYRSYCRKPQLVGKGARILPHDNADPFPERAPFRQSLRPLYVSQSTAQCFL